MKAGRALKLSPRIIRVQMKASHSLNLRLGEAVRPQTVTVRRQGKIGTPNKSGRAASNALAKQSPPTKPRGKT